ncbi:MAG: hypothetical protein RL367_1279, partial [Pseudomonadota bacterium]
SLHQVMPVSDCRRPRDFVQITLSSCHDMWEPLAEPPVAPVPGLFKRGYTRLFGR